MQVLLQWHRWTNFDPSRMEWNSWFSDLSRDCDEIFNIQFCFILLIRKLVGISARSSFLHKQEEGLWWVWKALNVLPPTTKHSWFMWTLYLSVDVLKVVQLKYFYSYSVYSFPSVSGMQTIQVISYRGYVCVMRQLGPGMRMSNQPTSLSV